MDGIVNATQAFILGTLLSGHKTGAHILTIARPIAGFWVPNRSQVYRELKLLAKRDLIVEAHDATPGVYAITEAGWRAYADWLPSLHLTAQIKDMWVLRLALAEHDGSDPQAICLQAAAYHRDATSRIDPNQLGADVLGRYHALMQQLFVEQCRSGTNL